MLGNIKNVIAAIDYIESCLHEKLDLDTIAGVLVEFDYPSQRFILQKPKSGFSSQVLQNQIQVT